MACKENHDAVQSEMAKLPVDQGGKGRHKCAACAYEKGHELGLRLEEHFDIGAILDSLPDSQAREQRHKSPHAAFAQGYIKGVMEYYNSL